jgi:hypothetical protein
MSLLADVARELERAAEALRPSFRTVRLRELLSVAAGGVVFTNIHKYFPEETSRARLPALWEKLNDQPGAREVPIPMQCCQ